MYFIGVDSGGTKTSFVLSDDAGRVLARHRSGSGGFLSTGRERIEGMLREGVTALCQRAAVGIGDVARAALGFPGYGESERSAKVLDELCARIFGGGRAVCACDCRLGWAGSFALEPGVNIVAGTGSICYGENAAGESARCSGWGAFCDEGSCRWIGESLIRAFTRQADGREPRTALYGLFRAHFGLEDDLHFIGPLNHELGPDGAKTAKLQVLLAEIHDAGDAVAARIYDEAAGELWQAVAVVADRLGLRGRPFPVSYSGGLFRAGERILGPLRARVEAGGGALVAPRFAPDLGAVLIAMRTANPHWDFSDFTFTE